MLYFSQNLMQAYLKKLPKSVIIFVKLAISLFLLSFLKSKTSLLFALIIIQLFAVIKLFFSIFLFTFIIKLPYILSFLASVLFK